MSSDQRELETLQAAPILCDSEVRDVVLEEISGLKRVYEEKERAHEAGLATAHNKLQELEAWTKAELHKVHAHSETVLANKDDELQDAKTALTAVELRAEELEGGYTALTRAHGTLTQEHGERLALVATLRTQIRTMTDALVVGDISDDISALSLHSLHSQHPGTADTLVSAAEVVSQVEAQGPPAVTPALPLTMPRLKLGAAPTGHAEHEQAPEGKGTGARVTLAAAAPVGTSCSLAGVYPALPLPVTTSGVLPAAQNGGPEGGGDSAVVEWTKHNSGKKFACFLSHHKGSCAMEARFLKDKVQGLIQKECFLDSDDLRVSD